MKSLIIVSSLLVLLVGCGKHSGSKSKASPVTTPPVVTTVTPSEEKFITDFQSDFKLPEVAVEEMKIELEKTEDPYMKSNLMFCAGVGAASGFDMISFSCRSFKGDKLRLSFYGIGVSFALHTDFTVLYGKKGSRPLKAGTYNVSLRALHLGLGGMGLRISNDNKSIDWRMKGLTLGLGMNMSAARMEIEKL